MSCASHIHIGLSLFTPRPPSSLSLSFFLSLHRANPMPDPIVVVVFLSKHLQIRPSPGAAPPKSATAVALLSGRSHPQAFPISSLAISCTKSYFLIWMNMAFLIWITVVMFCCIVGLYIFLIKKCVDPRGKKEERRERYIFTSRRFFFTVCPSPICTSLEAKCLAEMVHATTYTV